MEIKALNMDSKDYRGTHDMIVTDPPYEMPGSTVAEILSGIDASHLVLLTSMRQLVGFLQSAPDWDLSFDFVLDISAPKKSRNYRAPHYTHITCAYLIKHGCPSLFDRRKRQRRDVYEDNAYWPTIIHAPRERSRDHGMAKNLTALTDVIGAFDVSDIVDPFAGSGTVGLAAYELGISATLIERDTGHYETLVSSLRFVGAI